MGAERAPSQDRKPRPDKNRADKARLVEKVRDMDPAGVFEPRAEGPRKGRGGKPFNQKGGQKGGQQAQKFGERKSHKPNLVKGNAAKSGFVKSGEGAQFKRRAKA